MAIRWLCQLAVARLTATTGSILGEGGAPSPYQCLERGTEPIIPKPKTTGVKGLGKPRYVVEETFALPGPRSTAAGQATRPGGGVSGPFRAALKTYRKFEQPI